MKIGILTFHFAYNYGAMLQAYSLFEFLKNKDLDVEIIDYRPQEINYLYRPNFRSFIKHPRQVILNKLIQKIKNTNFTNFDKFLQNEFILGKDDYKYDCIIVGSDQVWNSEITQYDEKYLLKDCENTVFKISYAASLGKSKFDKKWEEEISKYVNEFQKISVRERNSKDYLSSLISDKEINVSPDPVFLMNNVEWRRMENKIDIPDKYILFYSLSGNEEIQEKATLISNKENLQIVSIHPLFAKKINNGITRSDIGPKEFLWLIDHASYVCTDSFHATAFSIIFNKKVIVKMDFEKGGRVPNLLKETGAISKQLFDNIVYYNLESKDKFEQYSNQGIDFLNQCISMIKEI